MRIFLQRWGISVIYLQIVCLIERMANGEDLTLIDAFDRDEKLFRMETTIRGSHVNLF